MPVPDGPRNYPDDPLDGTATLTPRQREVACLLAAGLTPAEVAARLSVSAYTVREHIRHLYEQLDCHHRGQLIAVVLRSGLCAEPSE